MLRAVRAALLCLLLLPLQALTPAQAAGPPPPPAAAAVQAASSTPSTGAGLYTSLPSPQRLLDTGAAYGWPTTTPIPAQGVVTTTFTGRGGIPATGVSGITVNVIALTPTQSGALPAWPTGETRPGVSGLLFTAGTTYTSASTVLKLSASGQASFANLSTGTVRIVADVTGYFTTEQAAGTGSRFVALKQSRILDTRNKIGVPTNTVIGSKGSATFAAVGIAGLPAPALVSAVVLNVTALSPTALGGWTLHPAGSALPTASHGNFAAQRPKSSTAVARVAADGRVTIYNNSSGTVHFTADIVGYFTSATNTAPVSTRMTPVSSRRVLDTGATLVPAGTSRTVKLAGLGGVPATNIGMVAVNLIAQGTATSGEVMAYPAGDPAPTPATDVVFPPNGYSFNLLWIRLNAAGEATLTNRTNAGMHLYLDVQGYTLKPALPQPPTSVVPNPGDKAVTVSWTPPTDTGDLPIKGYEVSTLPAGPTTTVTTPSATIGGLENGQNYWFRVVALNAVGRSGEVTTEQVAPRAPVVPGAPFITGITPRDNAAIVSWSAPAGATTAVATYTLTATPGGATTTVPGTAREAILPGLVNGQNYAVTVKATNANGSGLSAPRSVVPKLAEPPLMPPINAVTALGSRIDVQWVPPADGGAVIDTYEVTAEPGAVKVTVAADTTVAALTGLTDGQQYTIQVRAHNKAGFGSASSVQATPDATRAPAAPDDVQAAPSASGTIQLRWTAPIDVGTSPVTGYTVTVAPGGRTVDTTTTAATVAGLDPAIDYTFTVTARNAVGAGAAAPPAGPIKPSLAVKQAPVVLTAASLAQITSISSTALVVSAPTTQLTGLQPNALVVAGVSPTTPEGFLRRVVKTQQVGGLFVVSTEEAALGDAFDTAALSTEIRVTGDDLAGFVPATSGVRLRQAQLGGKSRKQQAQGLVKGSDGGEVKTYVKDGAIVLEVEKAWDAGGKINGTLTIDPHFSGSFHLGFPHLTSDVTAKFDTSVDLRVDVAVAAQGTRKYRLGSVPSGCVVVPVGGAPVTVCPRLDIFLIWDAEGKAGVAFKANYSRTIGAHLTSNDGSVTGDGINEPHPKAQSGFSATAFGNVTNTVGLAPNAVLALYGAFGPSFQLHPYFEYEIDTADDPWQKVVFGVEVGAGLSLDVLRKNVVNWVKPDILKWELPLWDSGGPFIGLDVDPGAGEVALGETITFKSRLVGWPDEPATWKVLSGPGTINAQGLFTPSANGEAVVEATVPASGVHPLLKKTAKVQVGPHLPSEPTAITVTPGNLAGFVTWEPPARPGGAINQYVVTTQPDTGQQTISGNGRSATIRNLTPGTSYVVNVVAVGPNGPGTTGSTEPFEANETIVTNPGGSDLARDVAGTDVGIDGAALSESGRYAFFASRQGDGKLYLIRRDLANGSYQTVSIASDQVTPQPISAGAGSILFAPYATAGQGRYIAYRVDASDGTGGTLHQVVVRDLETNTSWTSGSPAGVIQNFRLSADGQVLAYTAYRNSDPGTIRQVYRTVKGGAPQRIDTCLDTKSCGVGDTWTLGLSADGNTVIYNAGSLDPAGPYYGKINTLVFYNAVTGASTLPYAGKGLDIKFPVFSKDASYIGTRTLIDDPVLGFAAMTLVRKVGTGPFTTADVVSTKNSQPVAISDDGDRIAWESTESMDGSRHLNLFTRSTNQNLAVPSPWPALAWSDNRIDIAASGTALTWTPNAGASANHPMAMLLG